MYRDVFTHCFVAQRKVRKLPEDYLTQKVSSIEFTSILLGTSSRPFSNPTIPG